MLAWFGHYMGPGESLFPRVKVGIWIEESVQRGCHNFHVGSFKFFSSCHYG